MKQKIEELEARIKALEYARPTPMILEGQYASPSSNYYAFNTKDGIKHRFSNGKVWPDDYPGKSLYDLLQDDSPITPVNVTLRYNVKD